MNSSVVTGFRSLLVLATLALLSAAAAATPSQADASGVWSGSMEVGGESVEIVVTLQATTTGDWTGAIDIPAQNTTGYPLTEITLVDDAISFAMAGVPGDPVFNGTRDAANLTISGVLEQGGQVFPFALTRTADAPETTVASIDPETAAKIAGTWNGSISAGAQSVRIVFHIVAGSSGALTATLDSPDQGQTGLPVNRVAFDGRVLLLALEYVGANFEGTLTDDGNAIDGNWSQGGASVPLRMERQ